MRRRLASLTLTLALVWTLGGTSVLANSTTTDKKEAEPATTTSKEGQPNEKLRAGITKLLADAKAGKGKVATSSQIQPAKSNGLSKGKKIAIGVGVAVVVVAVIVVLHARKHFFDDFNLSGIAIR